MISGKLDNFLANYGYNIDDAYVYTEIPCPNKTDIQI
jgi:hypothetical protein